MVQGTGKYCIALLPAVVATLAIGASVLSTIWCEAIAFEPSSSGEEGEISFPKLQFGLYYYARIQELSEEDAAEQDFFAVTEDCVYYESSVDMDAAWKTARAFAIIAPLLGAILALGLYVSPCCIFFTRRTWNKMAVMFILVVPASQALTLLFLTSDACQENPVIQRGMDQWIKELGLGGSGSDPEDVTENEGDMGNSTTAPTEESDTDSATSDAETALMSVYGEECSWDWGSYANLASMILFFLTGVVMIIMGPPVRPDPREPEMQTVTYQQTTNENGEMTVQEVDVQTTTPKEQETAISGGPVWADPSHNTAKVY